jgi:hypothetical protein
MKTLVPFLACATLAACAAAVNVRGVGNAVGLSTYDLDGIGLAALDAQARELCPGGHTVLHRWEQVHRAGPDAPRVMQWAHTAGTALGAIEADRAQMTVQCTAPMAATVMPAASPSALPAQPDAAAVPAARTEGAASAPPTRPTT